MDASEIHAPRLNAQEVSTPRLVKNFVKKKTIADGTAKLSGRDHGVRNAILRRDQPAKSGDLRGDLQGNAERSQPTAATRDDAEARNDFWSMEGDFINRHHVERRVQFYVPTEETFQSPLKTHTHLDVLQESRIDDHWNVDVDRNLSDSWTGFTEFTLLKGKTSQRIYAVRVAAYKGSWPGIWSGMSKAAQKKRKLRGIYFVGPESSDGGGYALRAEDDEASQQVAGDGRRSQKFQQNFKKIKHACIVEAHESTRKRLESTLPGSHEDHITGKEYNSTSHKNLVHKFVPRFPAMRKPGAKAAVDVLEAQ